MLLINQWCIKEMHMLLAFYILYTSGIIEYIFVTYFCRKAINKKFYRRLCKWLFSWEIRENVKPLEQVLVFNAEMDSVQRHCFGIISIVSYITPTFTYEKGPLISICILHPTLKRFQNHARYTFHEFHSN